LLLLLGVAGCGPSQQQKAETQQKEQAEVEEAKASEDLMALEMSLPGTWYYTRITSGTKADAPEVTPGDSMIIDDMNNRFQYWLQAPDLATQGTYQREGKQLIFKYQDGSDTTRTYKVKKISPDTLVLMEPSSGMRFHLSRSRPAK
jgi:hypothetical protein